MGEIVSKRTEYSSSPEIPEHNSSVLADSDSDPTLTQDSLRENVLLGDIKYLGKDVVVPVPAGMSPVELRKIILEFIGEAEDEEVPIINSGSLTGYRFGLAKTGGYLSRVARVFGTIEQIKTGTFDDWPDINNEFIEYLGFGPTKIEDTVVLNPEGSMVAMCRVALGSENSIWEDFEISHTYDLTGGDSSLPPIDMDLFRYLNHEIQTNGGFGSLIEISAVAIAEEYQDTDTGYQLLMTINAAIFSLLYDTRTGEKGKYNFIITSAHKGLADKKRSDAGFSPFGPPTKLDTVPIWASVDDLLAHYAGITAKPSVEGLIEHIKTGQ